MRIRVALTVDDTHIEPFQLVFVPDAAGVIGMSSIVLQVIVGFSALL